jgi:hypothetical protein
MVSKRLTIGSVSKEQVNARDAGLEFAMLSGCFSPMTLRRQRVPLISVALLLAGLLAAGWISLPHKAAAQAETIVEDDIPIDGGDTGDGEFGVDDDLPDPAAAPPRVPSAPLPPPPSGPTRGVLFEALLAPDTPAIPDGVTWRIFATDSSGQKLGMVSEATGGSLQAALAEGSYFIHAAYGRAGITKRIDVGPNTQRESVVLNAGGLRLSAFVGKETRLPVNLVSFDIFVEDGEIGERTLVLPGANAEKIIRLNAGTYHIIGRYGNANAVVRADVTVQAGKLTDAILYHKASRVTLKLVRDHGGEAMANTGWSVLAPNGDSVFSESGAFPTVVLAAGQYTAVARHDSRIYRGTFTVETDLDRDIEVLAVE